MAINKINKYGLESKAVALKTDDKSFTEIARVLSIDSKHQISESSVQRFFASLESAKRDVVQKSDKLKSKLVEAEINTLQEALECIEDLRGICQEAKAAGDLRTAILAVDSIYKGLDILNKQLGKYQTTTNNQFNFTEVNIDSARERIISRLASLAPKK